jgi:hypothetical protein
MISLNVKTANITIEENGNIIYFGECKQEMILRSWGDTGTYDMRRKIEGSKCYWSVKSNEEIDLSTERGLGAADFEQKVRSLKFDSMGYISFYKDYDTSNIEIFLSKNKLSSFQYLLDKFISNGNYGFEINIHDFSELSRDNEDSKIPTLDDFFNNKRGVLVSELSFSLKQQTPP